MGGDGSSVSLKCLIIAGNITDLKIHFCLCSSESGKSLLCHNIDQVLDISIACLNSAFWPLMSCIAISWILPGAGISFILWNKPPSHPLTLIWENLFLVAKEILFSEIQSGSQENSCSGPTFYKGSKVPVLSLTWVYLKISH